jgi:hypothetical protein
MLLSIPLEISLEYVCILWNLMLGKLKINQFSRILVPYYILIAIWALIKLPVWPAMWLRHFGQIEQPRNHIKNLFFWSSDHFWSGASFGRIWKGRIILGRIMDFFKFKRAEKFGPKVAKTSSSGPQLSCKLVLAILLKKNRPVWVHRPNQPICPFDFRPKKFRPKTTLPKIYFIFFQKKVNSMQILTYMTKDYCKMN